MDKLKNYALIVLGALLILSVIAGNVFQRKYKEKKAEAERVSNNYRIAQDVIQTVKGENGLLASRLEAQELTIKEIRTYNQNIEADISDMKIQLRKVSQITAFNTETTNNINTFFKDSTVIAEKPVEVLNYSDRWFDIRVRKEGLQAQISAISRDSLIQVVHWDRTGKFWLTRWMTPKVFYQDIKSMNPGSRITYNKWITPVKK